MNKRLLMQLVLPGTFVTSLAAACGRDAALAAAAGSGHATSTIEEVSDSSVIAMPHAELFPLVAVEQRDLADRLVSTCVITTDINRTVPVNALGSGRVAELKAKLGDDVEQGQTLVVINSPDLSGAIQNYQHAVADEILAQKQLDRSTVLFDHGSIARKDLEAAEDAEAKAKVDLGTTAAQVRMMGGDVEQPAPFIELKAPISGTIVQQAVTPAAGVKSPDNAPNLFTIADLSRVWALCDVYENDLARVQLGEVANVRLNAYPDREFRGRIGNISPLLDSVSRTVKVRVELDNARRLMRLGMFATAEIVSRTPEPRLVVPTAALLRLHDADWAFVKNGLGRYRRQLVQAGLSAGEGFQQVIAGLARGDSIVKDALQFSQAAAHE